MTTPPSLADLRRRLRAARAALPARARREAARQVARHLRRLPAFRAARHVAGYLAVRGELDPAPALALARARGARVYLPVVRGPRLWFARHEPGDDLRRGHYGIPAPARAARVRAGALQVVLMPVVAVDATGNRVGSGGGYYDRSFARRLAPRHARRPLLIGIAYDFQRVDALAPRPHDVAVDIVVTPGGVSTRASRLR
jgi:5-formyltetrahydrofolate cyclo-ligase